MALGAAQACFSDSGLRAQQLDPGFHPPVFTPLTASAKPSVTNVMRQADGRYIVAGQFRAVDGHVTDCLARLLADGNVDTTFAYRPAQAVQGGWTAVAVQADGKVLAALRTADPLGSLRRILPSGQPDASFQAALGSRPNGGHGFGQIVVQPDGKLLLAGTITDSLGRNGLVRLLPTGRVDATFNPPVLPANPGVLSVALEPTGRMVYSHSSFNFSAPVTAVTRLLASGRVDSSFTFTVAPFSQGMQISKVVRCPDGSYALGGWFANNAVGRISSTGAWDIGFPFSVACYSITWGSNMTNPIGALAVQPDGRVLVSGNILSPTGNQASVMRTLPTGGSDASFSPDFIFSPYQSSSSPAIYNNARVLDLLVEPGGKLLVAGEFVQAGLVYHTGLARLLPAAPLASRGAAAAAAPLAVWPVPAHGQLHVALPAGPLPQQVALLDATGRTVLAQQPKAAALILTTAALPAGLYVLRVRHADGSVASRRVVLE
jgi:uncharacterized delta-60 repeat protein